ncbi:MAG: right-handed parallel beta-helix repeat-containing protein [Candidatus Absconditabacterales bacterium]|nr:right-handed parallel beta-helix repeat-containing protein [Candidatus Absconditabacterales bacterium]
MFLLVGFGVNANLVSGPLCTEEGLRAAISQAEPNTTITLDCPDPVSISSPLIIDKPLTIEGQGAVLDGGGKSRLFVIVKQIGWLIDGRLNPTPQQGGAGIHVTFRHMTRQHAHGAPFRFADKTAKPETTTDGSALYVGIWGHATLDRIIARGNSTPTDGGVIYIHGGDSGTLTIKNSRFEGNTAGGGGSVVASQQVSNLTVDSSEFHGNISQCKTVDCLKGERGGALRIWAGGTLTVRQSLFSGNKANLGGAINILQAGFDIQDSHFFFNESLPGRIVLHNQPGLVDDPTMNETRGGGAIYADTSNRGPSKIVRSHFEGNRAQMDGGAIYMYLRDARLMIDSTRFVANHVLKSRGAALGLYGKVILTDTIFEGNTVGRPDQHTNGRVLFPEGNDVTLVRTSLTQTNQVVPPTTTPQDQMTSQETTLLPQIYQSLQPSSQAQNVQERQQIATLVALLRQRKNRMQPAQWKRFHQSFVARVHTSRRLTARQKEIWQEALRQVK